MSMQTGIVKQWTVQTLPPDWFRRQQADQKATAELEENVRAIISQVKAEGDKALIEFALKFDKAELTFKTIKVRPEEFKEAYTQTSTDQLSALKLMKERISNYQKQLLTQTEVKQNSDGISIQTDLQMQRKLAILLRKYSAEQNVCERQGRCALGCIPGARHTFSKKIYDIIKDPNKKKHFEVRALCEVYDIEPLSGVGSTYNYRVYYTDYSAREWIQATFSWNQGSNPFKLDIKLFRTIDEGKKKTIESKKLILAAGSSQSSSKRSSRKRLCRIKFLKGHKMAKCVPLDGTHLGCNVDDWCGGSA